MQCLRRIRRRFPGEWPRILHGNTGVSIHGFIVENPNSNGWFRGSIISGTLQMMFYSKPSILGVAPMDTIPPFGVLTITRVINQWLSGGSIPLHCLPFDNQTWKGKLHPSEAVIWWGFNHSEDGDTIDTSVLLWDIVGYWPTWSIGASYNP